jgi:4-hydroxybenzoate polyprenyltransferase
LTVWVNIQKKAKPAIDYFVFTSLFIACCALLMVYQTYHLFQLANNYTFLGFVLAGTMCSYNFHWYLTPPHLNKEASPKTKWNLRNKNLHLLLALLALVSSGFFFFLLIDHWFWLCASALLTFLYTAPKIQMQPFIGLRKIAYGKTIFLSLAWMHITVMLPFFIASITWNRAHIIFSINRFLFIYAICILFDLRDRDRDKKDGIKSLITFFNEQENMRLFHWVLFLFFGTSILLLHYFTLPIIFALTIPGLLLLYYGHYFKRSKSDYVYYFILDGLMALSLPLLLIFQV